MASSKTLSSLKASQLKHAGFLMGMPTTGTKAELEKLIRARIGQPALLQKAPKIVSVDMGIKNLGVCALEVRRTGSSVNSDRGMGRRPVNDPLLKIISWKKIDVLSHLTSQSKATEAAVADLDEATPAKAGRKRQATKQPSVSAAAFTPSALGRTALSVTKDLLALNPTHILIERQRFRSGGASAVQEWTLRVNMLESMIWACLETLRHDSDGNSDGTKIKGFPEVYEVNPARVAKFWCVASGTTVPKGLLDQGWKPNDTVTAVRESRKIDKKEKIAVVRSWLSHDEKMQPEGSKVALEFGDEALTVANGFLSETKRKQVKNEEKSRKLDDLADCLLQGVAWVRWQENQQQIKEMLAESAV